MIEIQIFTFHWGPIVKFISVLSIEGTNRFGALLYIGLHPHPPAVEFDVLYLRAALEAVLDWIHHKII